MITFAEDEVLKTEKSIKTPMFDGDFENQIISAGNDLLSDEHNDDNSCIMMLEREW